MKTFAAANKHATLPHRPISTVAIGRVVAAGHGQESPVRRILRGAPWQRKLTVGVPDNVHAQSSGRMRDKIRLRSPPRVQRQDDPDSPSGDAPSSDQSTTGRAPEPNELSDLGVHDSNFPNLTEYRILRERTYGFNCFAWAVGIEDGIITSTTISQLNYSPNLDGWTRYLMDNHGFVRYANGADAGADLVLFGESEHMVVHAARKAAHPYGRMTFSSKLGERSKTPVILHALADLEGGYYGNVLRSFWKAPESEEQKSGEQTQPTQSESNAPLRRKTMENETKEQIGSRQATGGTLLTAPQIERKVAAMQGGGQPLPASERALLILFPIRNHLFAS